MEARIRDRIFGTGRSAADLRGTFAPAGADTAQQGSVLASYQGPGRDRVLRFMQQHGITPGQRAANAAAATAVEEIVDAAAPTRGFAGATTAVNAGKVQSTNPVYDGLMAQSLMREHGFVAPTAPPAATAAATVDAPIASAADGVAARVADLESRMIGVLQRLGEPPQGTKAPAHAGPAFERVVDDAVKVAAPVVDDAAHAAPAAANVVASVADDVAKVAVPVVETVAAKAVPKVVEAAKPSVLAAVKPSLLVGGADDIVRAGMSFSAGIDDTLRLLARF